MNKFIFCLVMSINFNSYSQKSQLIFSLPIDSPVKKDMPNMQTSVAFGISYAYRPIFGFPMMCELKTSFGNYAYNNSSNYYQFENHSSPTKVDFKYINKMNKFLIGTKWLIGHDIKAIRGFISPQCGFATLKTINEYSYYDTKTYSDRNTVYRNTNFIYGGEVGFELKFNGKKNKKQIHRILASTSIYSGVKNSNYTNVHNLQLEGDTDFALNNYVHMKNKYFYDDKVTQLHSTPFLMWGINVGYVLSIGYEELEDLPVQP